MLYPKVKGALYTSIDGNNVVRFSKCITAYGKEVQDDNDRTLWNLLKIMDGEKTVNRISAEMKEMYPDLPEGEVEIVINKLWEQGIIEDSDIKESFDLTEEEINRYSRNLAFYSIVSTRNKTTLEFQSLLKKSSVSVVGLGGIGSMVASILAASGVGKIYIADNDKVELANITRQILFDEGDIGNSKVEAAIGHLKKINSQIEIRGEEIKIEKKEDLMPIMKKSDFFVNGIDTPSTILNEVNDAAMLTETPWIDASYEGPRYAVSVYIPHKTPCYRCVAHNENERKLSLGIDNEEYLNLMDFDPVIGPVSIAAASLAASEVIFYLTGIPLNTLGKAYNQDIFQISESRITETEFWASCPSCGMGARKIKN